MVEVSPDAGEDDAPGHHYYIVLETEGGHAIVTEQSPGGLAWRENPANREARSSLAKTVCSSQCGKAAAITVKDARCYQHEALLAGYVSPKHYAQGLFNM